MQGTHLHPETGGSGAPSKPDRAPDEAKQPGTQADTGDFIESLSHKLKTPLTAIIGLSETLLRKKEMDTSTQRRFLEKIGDQAARLSSLLDDLLTLSILQFKDNALTTEQLDLRVPIAAAVQDLVPVAEEKGLRLEIDSPIEPVIVKGDYGVLRTMVGNLLDNAIKYTEYGGSIRVRLSSGGGVAQIEVEDTGVGIAPEEQEKVFDRFFRGEMTCAGLREGMGLGLAMVRQIALAHGGDVSLVSTPGEGSTFTVRLPLADPG